MFEIFIKIRNVHPAAASSKGMSSRLYYMMREQEVKK